MRKSWALIISHLGSSACFLNVHFYGLQQQHNRCCYVCADYNEHTLYVMESDGENEEEEIENRSQCKYAKSFTGERAITVHYHEKKIYVGKMKIY
jgi:hypothetical protein